ncbi:DUF551 domain-containing protein [Cronobacter sakazakii]|uniref:DUF551 domain-containing protein n=1 Tax=Cronobacter sakazakii TaxID=28141 RepID=UPI00131A3E9C|nr:DUF551 domain-containing protein [Cronobacter sakazakii]
MSTISNERLESLQRQFKEEGFNDISDSEVMQLVEENLALRKEREKVVNGGCEKCGGNGSVEIDHGEMGIEHMQCPNCVAKPMAETDTTAQQFESLEGKAVSGSEGFECTPVADLYELLTKCGECYDYTTSAKVAADWIKEGYSAREYVKLDRLQEAMTQGSPGEADGWIPCSERMPEDEKAVLIFTCGYLQTAYFDTDIEMWGWGEEKWHPCDVTHWKPLPEPPCK